MVALVDPLLGVLILAHCLLEALVVAVRAAFKAAAVEGMVVALAQKLHTRAAAAAGLIILALPN
jgi:hypothetical protein